MELSAKDIAEFDQAFTGSQQIFFQLMTSYVLQLVKDEGRGIPKQVTVVSLADFLQEQWAPEELVSALAAAVVTFADHASSDQCTVAGPE